MTPDQDTKSDLDSCFTAFLAIKSLGGQSLSRNILNFHISGVCTGVAAQSCCSMRRLSGLAGGRAVCICWMRRAGPCCLLRAPRRQWPRSSSAGLPKCPSLPPTSQVPAQARMGTINTALKVVATPQQHSTGLALGSHCELRRADLAILGPLQCSACWHPCFVCSSTQSGWLQGSWRMCWGRCWRRSSRACWACWGAAPAAP